MNNVISFSGGRSSAYMTSKLLEQGGEYLILFANTGKEHTQTLNFVQRMSEYWRHEIVWLEYCPINKFKIVDYKTASRNGEPFKALIEKRKYLPNVMTRFCTADLKIKPIMRYLKSIGITDYNNIMGIRYDEPTRWGKLLLNQHKERYFNVLPMVEWETTKKDVADYWQAKPELDLQIKSEQGNCDLCFLKGKRKLINLIKNNPSLADWWQVMEDMMGAQFNKSLTYSELKQAAQSNMSFDFDDEIITCFCNAD
jgi:3'-phosphoadenosine 5'-phosphosulfate sulfotransferase (PAPS reductase)/FAD synthetase